MKNKKSLGIVSLIISIMSLIPLVLSPDTLKAIEIIVTIGIILAIIGTILGFISKKEAKGLAVAGIVIGIISLILLLFSVLGITQYPKLTNCKDNGDGTATCEYMGQEIPAPTKYLTEDQMKKEE